MSAGPVRPIAHAPPIELDAVDLGLSGRAILSDVTLRIEAGELVGVLGPNGAGKTTLLRALLGLVPPSAGRIAVLGAAPTRGNPAIGYMPQARNLAVAGRLAGRAVLEAVVDGHRWGVTLDGRARRQAVDAALEAVEGTALAERRLGTLSGGERQRVLLAASLVGQPKLLLLDEPLMALDPHQQEAMVALVDRVRRRLGIAVLLSAHELNPILGAVDRILYLGSGAASIGTVDEVITGPVLSRLYGSEIEVIRVDGRVFVMAGAHPAERDHHAHPHAH